MTDKPAAVTLWGEVEEPFEKAVERYGVWPVTVWDCDLSDPATRKLKAMVGDDGSARPGGFMSGGGVYGGVVKETVFNPAVASWLLNLYAPPPPSVVFDPFAGGGTRAICTAASGRSYNGIELRPEEVAAVADRIARSGVAGKATVVQGDARMPPAEWARSADLLLTCPPYWNLERYNGGPNDLSMASSYASFLGMVGEAVVASLGVLKPLALALWVVGLHRDAAGGLLAMNHDVARLHTEAGFRFKEEIVLAQRNNGAIRRVGNFERGDRRLVRTHEYALVFEAPA